MVMSMCYVEWVEPSTKERGEGAVVGWVRHPVEPGVRGDTWAIVVRDGNFLEVRIDALKLLKFVSL